MLPEKIANTYAPDLGTWHITIVIRNFHKFGVRLVTAIIIIHCY